MWAFRIYHTLLNPPVQYNICKNLHELYHLLLQVYNLPFPTYVVLDLFPLMQRPSSFTLIAAEHSAGWMHHSWYWIFLLVKKKNGLCWWCVFWWWGAGLSTRAGDTGLDLRQGPYDLQVAWLVIRAVPAQHSSLSPSCRTCIQVPRTPRVLTQQACPGHIQSTCLFSLSCASSGPLFSVFLNVSFYSMESVLFY